MGRSRELRRVRTWLALFIVGLLVSGITAFPLRGEVSWLTSELMSGRGAALAKSTHLRGWLELVRGALDETGERYPFLAYGTDWLAFAHLMIAVAFVGPLVDPVRNKWMIAWGLVACAAVIPLALIAGAFRGIPPGWRLVDCSFGILGSIPLLVCWRAIGILERQAGEGINRGAVCSTADAARDEPAVALRTLAQKSASHPDRKQCD